jgi:predicted nucleotidyltransferase
MDLPEIEEKIIAVLDDFPEVLFATVYGSAAKGRMGPRSDVDIAVAGEDPLDFETRIDLMTRLSEALSREVDVLDLQSANCVIFIQALGGSHVVLNRKPSLYAALLRKMWYLEADWMPYYRRMVDAHNRKFFSRKPVSKETG